MSESSSLGLSRFLAITGDSYVIMFVCTVDLCNVYMDNLYTLFEREGTIEEHSSTSTSSFRLGCCKQAQNELNRISITIYDSKLFTTKEASLRGPEDARDIIHCESVDHTSLREASELRNDMLLFIRPFNLFLKVILRTVHTILNIKPKQKIKKNRKQKN